MSRKKNIRRWAQLRLLCCSGLDLMAVAPDALKVAHDLVPHAASALFLTSHDGAQQATYHEDCPVAVQQLCAAGGSLFEGAAEWNVRRLVTRRGAPKVGQLWKPPREYFSSNTYQLLVRGCGHHHTIDARLEVHGQRIGVVSLFREPGLGFDAQDLEDLARIAVHLEHAAKFQAAPGTAADGEAELQAMVVATSRGDVVASSLAAQALLEQIPLTGAQWPDRRRLPPACLRLIEALKGGEAFAWHLPSCSLPLAGGTLELHAQWMLPPGEVPAADALALANRGLVGITLTRRTPVPLRVWRNLGTASLSPRQMEVAFWMGLGGGREAARARMDIGEAVLRDCVRAVYDRLGCSSEPELVAHLRKAPDGGGACAAAGRPRARPSTNAYRPVRAR